MISQEQKNQVSDALAVGANIFKISYLELGKEEALNTAMTTITTILTAYGIHVSNEYKEGLRLELEKKVLVSEKKKEEQISTVLSRKQVQKWYNPEDWKDKMKHWDQYRRLKRKELPEDIVDSIDSKTNEILNLIADPRTALDNYSHFDIRGLVVGYVQSGKTGNYVGLINKAIDTGYKYVIVLSGIHDNLRSQTQERIDEGIIGVITRENQQANIGIGFDSDYRPDIRSMTSYDSDFGSNKNVFSLINNEIRVWVVKKNKSILENLNLFIQNLIEFNGQTDYVHKDEVGISRLTGIPLLIVDDEADQASIDTNKATYDEKGKIDPEVEPTTINRLIRSLLNKFTAKTYVAYTATPFANIFIHSKAKNNAIGDDLFPRDFIVMMKQPSNYVGPIEVFGGTEGDDPGLPITRDIFDFPDNRFQLYHTWQSTDKLKGKNSIVEEYKERLNDILQWNNLVPVSGYLKDVKISNGRNLLVGEQFMPGKHKANHDPDAVLKNLNLTNDLPLSIKHAIASFLLCCAVRIHRGHKQKHMSMLIHVTRYTAVQKKLTICVTNFCATFFEKIKQGDKVTLKWLKEIYESDFLVTMNEIQDNSQRFEDFYIGQKTKINNISHSWKSIEKHLDTAISKLTSHNGQTKKPNVRNISGDSKDLLDYYKYRESGLGVIAVGGDKLSRGLTLEGLMVSYYLRVSNAYDTLMQMGRWFGYRDGYVDVCRIYANNELLANYSHIAVAFEELRDLFSEMSADPEASPETFGLRVKDHPSMLITNLMKMRGAKSVDLDFSGKQSETVVFFNRADIIENNLNTAEELIRSAGEVDESLTKDRVGSLIWSGLSQNQILKFLKEYQCHPSSTKMKTETLIEYISKANNLKPAELKKWTLVLVGTQSGEKIELAGNSIGIVGRNVTSIDNDKISTGVITGNKEEQFDFSEAQIKAFMTEWDSYKIVQKDKGMSFLSFNKWVRTHKRPKNNGLLLLYPIRFKEVGTGKVKYPTNRQKTVIGVAVVTPVTNSGIKAKYKINDVAREEYFNDEYR
jgi:hypothetical protein